MINMIIKNEVIIIRVLGSHFAFLVSSEAVSALRRALLSAIMEGDQEPGDTMRWFSDTGEKKRKERGGKEERKGEGRGKEKEKGKRCKRIRMIR